NIASVKSGVQDPDESNNTAFVGHLDVADAQIIPHGGFNFSAVEAAPTRLLTLATFDDPGGPGGKEYKAVINGGDGGRATTVTVANGGIVFRGMINNVASFAVKAQHTYLNSGDFTISVTITHADLPPVTVTDTIAVSGDVIIRGTAGNDTLTLKSGGAPGTII